MTVLEGFKVHQPMTSIVTGASPAQKGLKHHGQAGHESHSEGDCCQMMCKLCQEEERDLLMGVQSSIPTVQRPARDCPAARSSVGGRPF